MSSSSVSICHHIKDNGFRCGSPAMSDSPFCFFHRRIHEAPIGHRKAPYRVGAMESTESVQIVLTHVLQALLDDALDVKKANALFRGLALALRTLRPSQREQLGSPSLSKMMNEFAQKANHELLATEIPAHAMESADSDTSSSEKPSNHMPDAVIPVREVHVTNVPSGKKPPATAKLSDAELARIRRIMRLGPKHPEFRRCSQQLDAHIAASKAG